MSRLLTFAAGLALAAAQLTSSSLENHVDSLTLGNSFNPVEEAYWTGFPHHRRTPFAVSPDGSKAFLAYLDSSGTGVHVQGVDPKTFTAVGDIVTLKSGKEAGGLVAHDDGFALLTNEAFSGEADGQPLAVLYRYTDGKESFRTLLGGPGLGGDSLASPNINGDLVFSEKANKYAAYIVVTSYSGSASGHFGDAIRYVNTDGKIEEIAGASSSWGCSHNTGIAFEEADEAPFASLCAEDQGAIWLNTETQGMGNNGVKLSNEMTINGGSNEPMGGMGGSYSVLSRFVGSDSYIFSWVSRGAVDLTLNDWMGQGYTKAQNRTNNRNVAIAVMSDKKTLLGEQAISTVGAADGDSQVNWITESSNDCSNAHVASFGKSSALVTWEEISNPVCPFEAMGCKGKFAGTKFQLVDSAGKKIGAAISSDDTYVSGDMVTMTDGRICWPYVNMAWSLDGPVQGSPVSKMSFACMSAGGSGSDSGATPSKASSAASQPAATKSAVSEVAQSTQLGEAQSNQVDEAQPTSSVRAVEDSAEASAPATVVDGAPRPSFVTLSESVTNVLTAPSDNVESSAVESSPAAAEEPTSVTAEPTYEAPAPVPTVPDSESSAVESSAPSATRPGNSDGDEECDDDKSPAQPSTEAPKATRTRTHGGFRPTRRPRPSGLPSFGTVKECATRTVTQTVYVTATNAPARY